MCDDIPGQMESNTLLKQEDEDKRDKQPSYQDIREIPVKEVLNGGSSNYRKWFVLVAGFFACGLVVGFSFNMSVLYVEWLDEFKRPFSETALVQSFCTGVFLIGGFASGFAITKYGPKRCGIFGGLITSIGVSCCYFATSIIFLVLSLGVISGIGMSLCYISASTIVGSNFDGKSKMLALAFTEFGVGIGSSVFPIILEKLTEKYGWRGALLLIGGIMFNLVACACIYKLPADYYRKRGVHIKVNRDSLDLETQIEFYLHKEKESVSNYDHGSLINTIKAICLNKTYLLYTVSFSVGFSTYTTIAIFFIDFVQSKGLSRTDAVLIYLYMNIVGAVSRLLLGFLKQVPHISILFISVVSGTLGCISTLAFVFVGASYTLNLLTALVYRIGYAMMVTALPMSTAKLVEEDNYSAGLGLTFTAVGTIQTIAGPISGYIRDVTGNYDASLFSASAVLFVSTVLFCITMLHRHYFSKHRQHAVNLNTENLE